MLTVFALIPEWTGKQGAQVGKAQGTLWRDLPVSEKDAYNKRAAEMRKLKPRGLTAEDIDLRNKKILLDIDSTVKRAGECN